MKSVGDIAQKLKQVQFRHSKKEIEKLLSRNPSNCSFQRKLEVEGAGNLGFCTCPQVGLKACDISAEHLNRAPDCPHFTLKMNVDEAKESVKTFFKNSSPAEVASRYPDVAALMWVLDDETHNPPDVYLVPGFKVPVWASSPESASECSEELQGLITRRKFQEELEKRVQELEQELDQKKADFSELKTRHTLLETCNKALTLAPRTEPPKKAGFFKSFFVTVCFFIESAFRK